MRSKLLLSALLLAVGVPSLLFAQTDRSNLQFYISARMGGQATVTVNDVGTIPSGNDLGDLTSVMNRGYSNGYVLLDTRSTDDVDKIPQDGRTNRWGFDSDSQITADGSAVLMSDYSTNGEGQTVSEDTPGAIGLDMEFAIRLGDYGVGGFGKAGPVSWGLGIGLSLNDLNSRITQTISSTLEVRSDLYSLLGATAPGAPYDSPSFDDLTIVNPDGTTSFVQVDNSILLENTPLGRSSLSIADGAQVNGYWEVDGAYFTVRLGPWFRWRPVDRLSLRFSAGVSATMLGASLDYDERATLEDGRVLQDRRIGVNETYTGVGYYGAADLEFWVTDVTAFFVGATYDYNSTELRLRTSDVTADVTFGANIGFRIGITTHF